MGFIVKKGLKEKVIKVGLHWSMLPQKRSQKKKKNYEALENAIGKERFYQNIVGEERLHNHSSDNGKKQIDFVKQNYECSTQEKRYP